VALAWNTEAAIERHAAVARAFGVDSPVRDDRMLAAALASAYDRFVREVGLPVSLAGDGLGERDAERLAEVAMAPENEPMRKANCREVGRDDALRLARDLLTAA
jgi:alcohol dehydrogenase class IV